MEEISDDCGSEGNCEMTDHYHHVDGISQFPDEILIVIISGLPLKDAGRTSILSARWRNLWKYTLRLNFHDECVLDRIAEDNELLYDERVNYVRWVNTVIDTWKSPTLSEFCICFHLDFSWQYITTKWLEFALAHQVERLELDLIGHGHPVCRQFGGSYIFPEEFLFQTGEGPSTMYPPLNGVSSDTPFNFASLKVLSLKCVDVSDLVLEFFVRQCPALEELVVWSSLQLQHLEVSGPSLKLKHLEIIDCICLDHLKLSNTNIRSICFTISPDVSVVLENLPSLVELSITLPHSSFSSDVFPMLSCCGSQLEVLTLCGCKPKDIVKLCEIPVLNKLKKLVLRFWTERPDILEEIFPEPAWSDITNILEEINPEPAWSDPCNAEKQVRKAAVSPHKFLKVLEIARYCGRISELELVRYFLENSVALKE